MPADKKPVNPTPAIDPNAPTTEETPTQEQAEEKAPDTAAADPNPQSVADAQKALDDFDQAHAAAVPLSPAEQAARDNLASSLARAYATPKAETVAEAQKALDEFDKAHVGAAPLTADDVAARDKLAADLKKAQTPPAPHVSGIDNSIIEAIIAFADNELKLLHEFVQKELLRRSL